jgi:glycine/D-amino acid oxidase-like deaminating enzyme
MSQTRSYDAVVIGAGIVGAACSYFMARRGLEVAIVERGSIAAGTTGACEGNILVSDKEPGPELDLAVLSNRLWRELHADLGDQIELVGKGGLVVAGTAEVLSQLSQLAAGQAASGVTTVALEPAGLSEAEPHLAKDLAGGVLYPQDMQVQPALAAVRLLWRAGQMGAELRLHEEVTGFVIDGASGINGVRTSRGCLRSRIVVNAAGTWAGQIAALAGTSLPVQPRRGFVIVTEPLPPMIRHKVYTAEYVTNVSSTAAALQTATVVEGTNSGPVLIGASRERVGFDSEPSFGAIAQLAGKACQLFPVLATVRAIRYFRGFRPYCPDHLPVIGPDPRVAGLFHACGHEGAGIGLAPATAQLITQVATEDTPSLPLGAFRADRFGAVDG